MFAFLKRPRPHAIDGFEALVQRASGRWYGACLRITQDAALAEDAVQDALLNAWRARDQFRGEAELDTWLHRIAINAALELMRKRGPVAESGPEPEDVATAADCPASSHVRSAFGSAVGKALDRLTTRERVCFVLKHIEQWRLEEIAAATNVSVDSVKQSLFRGLGKLRVELKEWRGAA